MRLDKNIVLSAVLMGVVLVGCGGGNGSSVNKIDENKTKQSVQQDSNDSIVTQNIRFTPMSMNGNFIMQDRTTKLEWVNGNPGCHPMTPGKDLATAMNEAENHCQGLSFAGHDDWRVPNITEVQKLL